MERVLRLKLPGGRFVSVCPKRARTMSQIRSRGNATTEQRLRMALVRSGISGWVMHPRDIPGQPDFFFPDQRIALFVDGCFWHGCPRCGHIPRTRTAYWKLKILRNRHRDRSHAEKLRRRGIEVIRIWEHSLKGAHSRLALTRIRAAIHP